MRTLKIFLFCLLVILLAVGGFWIYLQSQSLTKHTPLEAMHPESVMVMETQNLTTAWREVKNSELWSSLLEGDYLEEYEANMMVFDSLMESNALIRNGADAGE